MAYNRLLAARAVPLLKDGYGAVASYLMSVRGRGPGHSNADSLLRAILVTDRPGPFIDVFGDWIRNGRFDGKTPDGNEDPSVQYRVLAEGVAARSELMQPLVNDAIDHVTEVLQRRETSSSLAALDHLRAMLDAAVPFAGDVRTRLMPVARTALGLPEESLIDRAFEQLELNNGASVHENSWMHFTIAEIRANQEFSSVRAAITEAGAGEPT
jgi:hypothetical protein